MRRLAWFVLPVVLGVDAVWAAIQGWHVDLRSLASTGVISGLLATFLLLPRYRRDARIGRTLTATVQLILFTKLASMFSYLVIATNLPLIDRSLAQWDAAIGFDWVSWTDWIRARPWAERTSLLAYYSGLPQMALITIVLGFAGRPGRVEEFVLLLMLITVLTIVASGFWPAAGPFKYFAAGRAHELAALSHFEPLRQGGPWVMFAADAQGLISMPSLHTALGVLYIYALRGVRWVFPLGFAINTSMIAATPSVGGHYLVDVLAGALLAFAVIAFTRRWTEPSTAAVQSLRTA